MRLPAAERELSHSPRIFHGECTVYLNIGFELLKLWCAILGLNQASLPVVYAVVARIGPHVWDHFGTTPDARW